MIETNGTPQNAPNIIDAVRFTTNRANTIYDNQYNMGRALQAFDPDVPIMDAKIAVGALGGTYSIGFYYHSTTATVQGTPLMRFELYEDDVLIPEDTSEYSDGILYQNDLNYFDRSLTYGLFQSYPLDAHKTHRIVVKTSPELAYDAILDYLIFEKVPTNSILDGRPVPPRIAFRNGGDVRDISEYGSQIVYENVTGALGGSLAPAAYSTPGYTYNSPFKTIIGAYPTILDGQGLLNVNWDDWMPEYSQIKLFVRNVGPSTWSKAVSDTSAWNYTNVRILVAGYI